MTDGITSAFNSPLETGVRTLAVLVACYPAAHDLGRLVQYDYLTVHSADADGPPSLHPPLPLRSGELLVRRGLVESGLRLMLSRSLIRRRVRADGIVYQAEDLGSAFLDSLASRYIANLRDRAAWVASAFDHLTANELELVINRLFEAWTTEFQPVQFGQQTELFG
ncbi:MAG: threonine transporter [Mesorhizobium sp.]|uniref:ABC-three component system middle component 2 n=1 Tax=Mesorhizobium sp. TaxID=1871066 RepID=UPI000FE7847F|nr:ABC-three component system middle component 2 [Mesorhizobium sp.]RWL90979.1 MAG: threonine transporter [Mesorhizobium sp.]TIP45715.1 MAG: threonine transporter [Mesorhizobium sp.]TJV68179.1 MAG: threonine transporter [Mesorhizobium sp.]